MNSLVEVLLDLLICQHSIFQQKYGSCSRSFRFTVMYLFLWKWINSSLCLRKAYIDGRRIIDFMFFNFNRMSWFSSICFMLKFIYSEKGRQQWQSAKGCQISTCVWYRWQPTTISFSKYSLIKGQFDIIQYAFSFPLKIEHNFKMKWWMMVRM